MCVIGVFDTGRCNAGLFLRSHPSCTSLHTRTSSQKHIHNTRTDKYNTHIFYTHYTTLLKSCIIMHPPDLNYRLAKNPDIQRANAFHNRQAHQSTKYKKDYEFLPRQSRCQLLRRDAFSKSPRRRRRTRRRQQDHDRRRR